jgi:ribosomal protein S12 methylthiotransferase
MRGQYVSKPIEQVVQEAEQLAADGVRELILVAQDTTFYGIDLYGRPELAKLLARLERVPGLEWIRVMYLYPMHLTDELVEVLSSSRKILRYLDLPLQHINDKILRRMKRQVNRLETERLLDRLRERIAGLVLRTTIIVGFPGETEAQFEELLEFVIQRRFERLGVFAYSREPDTPASRLPDPVPPEVAKRRREQLLAAQQEIAFEWNRFQVGKKLDILIDSCIPGEKNAFVGRTYADAPEVDGVAYITGEGLQPGQIVPCEIVAARDYDLIAAYET